MTDFKTKMAELAAKYNISHQRDIDWHNFVYEVQRLKEDELNNVHDLKILPEYFQAVKSGEKTFEVRFADRPFQKGDVLHLREWDGNGYTGESIYVEVTYILDNPDFCKEGYVIMAIKPMSAEWSEVELESRGEKVKVKRPFFRDDKGRGYSTTEQDEDVAWYALRAWCEKKGVSMYDLYPRAEWSEEDSRILYNVIAYVGYAAGQRGVRDDAFKEANSWLKSLPERFNPQPKQELGEENETSIAVKNPEAYKIGFADGEAYAKEQAEWGEEDEKMHRKLMDHLGWYGCNGLNHEECDQLRAWLKSLPGRLNAK